MDKEKITKLKKELIKKATDIPSKEFFEQDEFTIGEEYRMSRLIDFVLEEIHKRKAKEGGK